MSFGLDHTGSPSDLPPKALVPGEEAVRARPDSAEPEVTIPSPSTLALPNFLRISETSIVNERLVLRTLQSHVNSLVDHLGAAGPADIFHQDLGRFALEEIQHALGSLVPEGTDFPSALAAVKSWTEPFIAAADSAPKEVREHFSIERRAELQDQKTMLSAAQRLERIHAVLAEPNPMTQRSSIMSEFGRGRVDVRELSSEMLIRSALLDVAADLARRTLDFSSVINAAESNDLRWNAVTLLANFGSETDPGPAMNFRSLPYAHPDRVRVARDECLQSLWGACLHSMLEQDPHGFNASFSALVVYGRQAMPYFHECLRRATLAAPRGGLLTHTKTPFERPSERMTKAALGMLGRLGPDPFAPFITFSPDAPDSPVNAEDVIQDALLLSQHVSSTTIQEYALMFLKACAFKRIPKAQVSDTTSIIGDDHPDFLRQYDSRVLAKFRRLTRQVHDMVQRQRCCVFSMIPLEQVLAFAANKDGATIPVVQLDALNDLETKLRYLAPRLAKAADPSAISSIFVKVRSELGLSPTHATLPISEAHRDIINFIDEKVGPQ